MADPKNKGDADWERWIRGLNSVTSVLGVAAYNIQVLAAERIADMLRKFLMDGVDPPLSPLTVALKGGREPALSSLARHVIVERPKQRRGAGGKFSTGFHPAVVTFHKEYEKIAFFLEKGSRWEPSQRLRMALIRRAIDAAGSKGAVLEEGMGSGGVWILPARPFMHILTGPAARAELLKVAEMVFSGRVAKRERMSVRPEIEESEGESPQFVSFDTVEGVLGDTPWDTIEDMIEFD